MKHLLAIFALFCALMTGASAVDFPDGGSWGTNGIVNVTHIGMTSGATVTWNGLPIYLHNPGANVLDIKGTGAVPLFRFYGDATNLVGSLQFPMNGVLGFTGGTAALAPDVGFMRMGVNHMGLGDIQTNGSHNGWLSLGTLDAQTLITAPDTSYFSLAGSFLHNIWIEPGVDTGILTSHGSIYYDYNGWGTTYRSGTSGAAVCVQYATHCMNWEQRFVANDGFQVWGLESGARDNHSLHIGAVRAAPNALNVSQLLITDNVITTHKAPLILINGPYTAFAALGPTEGDVLDNTLRLGGVKDTGKLWNNDPEFGTFNLELAGGYRFLDLDGTDATCVAKLGHDGGTITATSCDGSAMAPIYAKSIRLQPVAVASLDACTTDRRGTLAVVTDALAPAWGAPAVGGGDRDVTVRCDSSQTWIVD